MFKKFLTELYKSTQLKLIYCIGLMLLSALLESAGILTLFPLIDLINPTSENRILGWLHSFLSAGGISFNLPIILLIYIVIGVIAALIFRSQSILMIKIQQMFANTLSLRLFRAISGAKWQYIVTQSRANFINSLTMEISRISAGVNCLLQLIANSLLTIFQIILSLYIAPKLTLLILVYASIIFIFFYRFGRQARKAGVHLLYANQKLMFQATEHLNGLKEIKSYALHEQEQSKFKHFRDAVSEGIIQNTVIQTKVGLLYKITALFMVSSLVLIALNIYHTPISNVAVLLLIFARIWPKVSNLNSLSVYINGMLPALQNMLELEQELIKQQGGVLKQKSDSGKFILSKEVEFKQVYFRHNMNGHAKYNLSNISFIIPCGSTTAIVGLSGAGKSTIGDLLIGLLSPEKGEILLDGQNMQDNLASWSQVIAYVPQEAFIFYDTIRNNLIWAADNIADDEIWRVLNIVVLDVFVRQLAFGLDTYIGDKGITLSGGERQRLMLARALLRKPSILILDEATSALDGYNEQLIQQAIDKLHGAVTLCIIAHRLSTITSADQVIVLEQGKVKEIGSYQELLKNKDSYFNCLHSKLT